MFLLRKKGKFYFIIIVKKTKVRHFTKNQVSNSCITVAHIVKDRIITGVLIIAIWP